MIDNRQGRSEENANYGITNREGPYGPFGPSGIPVTTERTPRDVNAELGLTDPRKRQPSRDPRQVGR